MKGFSRFLSVAVAGVLAFAVATPPAHALRDIEIKCLENVAKSGRKFFKKKLKEIQKCNDKNLKSPGACPAQDLADKIAALEAKLGPDIDKKCAEMTLFNLEEIGYPGKCSDPDPNDGFTVADLKACVLESHENIVDQLIDIEYGATTGQIADSDLLKCQKAVAKEGGKYADGRLKTVQKCRNGLNKGKLSGFLPRDCVTADLKTAEKIAKYRDKAHEKILKACITPEMIAQLDVCDPPATTPLEAADCIIETHGDLIDNPDVTAASDLIDFQYAAQAICGDLVRNRLDEECDGTDDDDCPGLCGDRTGPFACLCLDKQRERVIEHKDADLDNGWTGAAHDQGVIEGGGYVVDMYDCDTPGGADPLCTVGPSCTVPVLGVNAPCTNDNDCGPNGPCRKERTAVGPHCNLDIQVACTTDAQCPGFGNFCVKTLHGMPLPITGGSVSVCVVNEFSEDIVGTTNLATGESAVRMRQWSKTHLEGNIPQPCPVCGGWCNDSVRRNCTTDDDCDPGVTCVTAPICSRGPNKDKECRPDPPFGGASTLYGTTSVDCPPTPGNIIAALDTLFNPITTSTVTLLPQFACNHSGFAFKTCRGGTNDGARCANDTECPGAVCSEQCFCNLGGGTAQAPNQCEAACVGGTNDSAFCTAGVDSECPGGFCHSGDCRDSGVDNEGICTSGPADQKCSLHSFRGCTSDLQCRPPSLGGNCEYCKPTETCITKIRECFVNSGLVRSGFAHPTDPSTVAVFCLGPTGNSATNNTAGLPGPAAIREVVTRVFSWFSEE